MVQGSGRRPKLLTTTGRKRHPNFGENPRRILNALNLLNQRRTDYVQDTLITRAKAMNNTSLRNEQTIDVGNTTSAFSSNQGVIERDDKKEEAEKDFVVSGFRKSLSQLFFKVWKKCARKKLLSFVALRLRPTR